jgi:hypothetical protein
MQFDPPAQESEVRRRLRGLLVWSGLTLLAALALAMAQAMVIASLAGARLRAGTTPNLAHPVQPAGRPANGPVSGWPEGGSASNRRSYRRRRGR